MRLRQKGREKGSGMEDEGGKIRVRERWRRRVAEKSEMKRRHRKRVED